MDRSALAQSQRLPPCPLLLRRRMGPAPLERIGLVLMPRVSAGLVMYRIRQGELEVFLGHPGGPFFTHRDDGYWTIPKGEIEEDEDHLATAIREFQEEVGIEVNPKSEFIELGSIKQKGGKIVHAWAVEQRCEIGRA